MEEPNFDQMSVGELFEFIWERADEFKFIEEAGSSSYFVKYENKHGDWLSAGWDAPSRVFDVGFLRSAAMSVYLMEQQLGGDPEVTVWRS